MSYTPRRWLSIGAPTSTPGTVLTTELVKEAGHAAFGGSIELRMTEPLSGQLIWVKEVQLARSESSYITHPIVGHRVVEASRHTTSSPMSIPAHWDGRMAVALEALQEAYPAALAEVSGHFDAVEMADVVSAATSAKERARFAR